MNSRGLSFAAPSPRPFSLGLFPGAFSRSICSLRRFALNFLVVSSSGIDTPYVFTLTCSRILHPDNDVPVLHPYCVQLRLGRSWLTAKRPAPVVRSVHAKIQLCYLWPSR